MIIDITTLQTITIDQKTTAGAWSPKGKQLALADPSGAIRTYKLDGTLAKTIAPPSSDKNAKGKFEICLSLINCH